MVLRILLPLFLAFIMFSLGLGLKKADFARVLKFPKAFGVGLFNQLVLLPLIAFALCYAFSLSPEYSVGLMILAFCPGGVTSNVLTKLAGGNAPLSISLTAVTSLLSIVTVPLLVALSVNHFMATEAPPVDVPRLGIAMFLITAVPVTIGMVFTAKSPVLVERIAPVVSKVAVAMFATIVLIALAKNFQAFSSNLGSLGPVSVLLNVSLLALGLATAKMIGLGARDATTISLESGVQNGTLALAVGSIVAGTGGDVLPPVTIPAVVYSITMYIVCTPFVLMRRRLND